MTKAETDLYNQKANIKSFALYNFAELKLNNPEYTLALQELTAKSSQELTDTVKQADTEIELANALVN